ncbi:MAG: hypothetical protein H6R16_3831 [Proteobacteria bacterium]|nr:hypothetical protein [Pseudomonadota bacterium]
MSNAATTHQTPTSQTIIRNSCIALACGKRSAAFQRIRIIPAKGRRNATDREYNSSTGKTERAHVFVRVFTRRKSTHPGQACLECTVVAAIDFHVHQIPSIKPRRFFFFCRRAPTLFFVSRQPAHRRSARNTMVGNISSLFVLMQLVFASQQPTFQQPDATHLTARKSGIRAAAATHA